MNHKKIKAVKPVVLKRRKMSGFVSREGRGEWERVSDWKKGGNSFMLNRRREEVKG